MYGFNVNCLVSAQHLKIQERFFFFVIVKNEKLMDVKVHGPMQYTGTEFFFFFCLYACFIENVHAYCACCLPLAVIRKSK